MTDAEQPLPDIYEAAAARRAELASDWPTAAQVGLAMGIVGENATRFVTGLRKQASLLGVYVTEPAQHWKYPRWQFNKAHQPIEGFSEILAILRECGNYLDDQGRTSGWCEVEWFMSAHVLLEGRTPREVVQEDPDAVLEAARVEYIEESNEGGF